jgi:hypothetical protein
MCNWNLLSNVLTHQRVIPYFKGYTDTPKRTLEQACSLVRLPVIIFPFLIYIVLKALKLGFLP